MFTDSKTTFRLRRQEKNEIQWEVKQTADKLLCIAVKNCCQACNYGSVGGLQRGLPN